MRVPLCLAVHGHMADSVRDHEPGRVAGSLWRGSGGSGSPNRWLLDLDGPLSLSAPEDHWRAGGLVRMVRGIGGPSREPCWYRGIAVDGAEPCRPTPLRFMQAATPGQQAAPAWSAWPAECNDQPWMNRLPVSRCRAVSADLLPTCEVPAVDLQVPRGTVVMTARVKKTRYLRSPDDVAVIARVCSRRR
jgi:hypothetical protein